VSFAAANTVFVNQFLAAVKSVVGLAPAALHEPRFSGNEWQNLKQCLDSTFVSSVGKFVDEFESMLAKYTGVDHAVAVVNGTAALHMALKLAGVKPGDEVLVPSLTFVATANAVAHCAAVPHLVDSDSHSMGLSAEALSAHLEEVAEVTSDGVRNRNTGKCIAAIVPMHTYGHAVEMIALMELANRYRLPVIEDAAESLGSFYRGRHTGSFGLMGVLSFNGNKIITTGGGGAILTNDAAIASRARHLTTTAKRLHRWEFFHDELAWNYRLPNINAALGCAQLQQLPDFVARKRRLAERYKAAFSQVAGVQFMSEPKDCLSNYWLNTVRLSKSDFALRDSVLDVVNGAGYQCRPAWTLLHKLPMYEQCPRGPLPVAEALEASVINLPSSVKLQQEF
jgi:perosamine synthetase